MKNTIKQNDKLLKAHDNSINTIGANNTDKLELEIAHILLNYFCK